MILGLGGELGFESCKTDLNNAEAISHATAPKLYTSAIPR